MEESFVIDIIDSSLEGLKYEHSLWEDLYRLGCEDNNDLNEIENYLIGIAWKTIIKARNIPEISENEFECFSDIMYDIMRENYSFFTYENQEYNLKNGKDVWEYFKGDHIEEFFDDDIKAIKNEI